MNQPSGNTAFARRIAVAMIEGFNKHYRLFREKSREAKPNFEAQAWQATAGPGATAGVHCHDSAAAGLRAAFEAVDPAGRIVVFGSFYTVGGVLKEGLPRRAAPHLG